MFGKKQPTYEKGHIVHFFEYAVEQFKKSIESARVETKNVSLFELFPADDSFTITYTPGKEIEGIGLYENDNSGKAAAPLYQLVYDRKGKKFRAAATFGPFIAQDLVDGKHPGALIPDPVYDAISSNLIVPVFGTDKRGRRLWFQGMEQKVKWRSGSAPTDASSGSIDGDIGR